MPLAMPREKTLRFRSGDIELEGRIQVPDDSHAPLAGREESHGPLGCVICHPHPLYGGDMDNNVVVAIAAALASRGIATLRFNFRGVGGSGGSHGGGEAEIGDARAAVRALASALGSERVSIAGYSFGSVVALQMASAPNAKAEEPGQLAGVAAIAPPLAMFDASFVSKIEGPLLLVVGDRDQYCPIDRFEGLEGAPTSSRGSTRHVVMRGADHFLGGYEDEVGKCVADWIKPDPVEE